MEIVISANYRKYSAKKLGVYVDKQNKYQDRYTEVEVVAIKGHQSCIINKRGTMEIIHTGFLDNLTFAEISEKGEAE